MMSETVKTSIFAAVALVVGLVAFVSRPRISVPEVPNELNKPLFPDFRDPADARELKIVKFDEAQGEFNEFEIAQVDGRWVIPSHANYPADAETQLKQAATCLIDLTVFDAEDVGSDLHAEYGLVEPDPKRLKAGDKGVGMLVSMRGADGKFLAQLVVSDKKLVDTPDRSLVRRVGEDRVYSVKLDASKLSTKFSDWIEKDLLKLNAFDVDQLVLKDYSVTMVMAEDGPTVSHNQRFELTATAEPSGSPSWRLEKFLNYRGREAAPTVLAENEELNYAKLDDMKSALDNLEIVDVRRKPKGLGANLRADEGLLKDREGIQSLASLGFLPLRIGQGPAEIYAANGEVLVRMKDGVEYVLRFGNIAGAEEGDSEKLNRYLLVTAQVNEAKFPPPVLEPLPDLPGEEPADSKEDQPKEEQPKDESGAKKEDGAEAPEKECAEPAQKEKEPAEKSAEKQPEEKAPDQPKAKEDAPPAAEKAKDDAKAAAQRKRDEIQAQRDRITKENKRKEDDYNSNRKKAEDKVRELNSRFADWYYVISEDVFKKVHLSRVDLIKEKTGTLEEGFGVDAFRKLEDGGLKPAEEKKPGGFDLEP